MNNQQLNILLKVQCLGLKSANYLFINNPILKDGVIQAIEIVGFSHKL